MILMGIGAETLIIRSLDFQHYKPLWLLKRESIMAPPVSYRALGEIDRRLTRGLLNQSDINGVADLALAEQGNTKKSWNNYWGNFLELARSVNKLDDSRWKRYAEQAMSTPTMVIRKKIRRGDPIPIGWTRPSARAASNTRLADKIHDTITVDLAEERAGPDGDVPYPLNVSGMTTCIEIMDPQKINTAPEGFYNARIRVGCNIYDDHSKEPLAQKQYDLKGKWELVAADGQTVKEIHDDRLGPQIESAITDLHLQHYAKNDWCSLSLNFGPLPIGVAFSLEFRAGNQHWRTKLNEWSGGIASSRRGGWISASGHLKDITADKVDIILHSDINEAMRTMDLDEMWVGEIVLKDVPVHRMNPSTKPSKR